MARIIIAIDAEGASTEKTYGKIFEFMKTLPQEMSWESTDEAYGDDGSEIRPGDLQEARMRIFAQSEKGNFNEFGTEDHREGS